MFEFQPKMNFISLKCVSKVHFTEKPQLDLSSAKNELFQLDICINSSSETLREFYNGPSRLTF